MRKPAVRFVAARALSLAPLPVVAYGQGTRYPDEPIRLIALFPPGGGTGEAANIKL